MKKIWVNIGRKLKGLAELIEAIVGGILGVIFGYYLGITAGVTIFGIGCLLSVSRWVAYRYFADEFEAVSEIYELESKILGMKDREFIDELIKYKRRFLYKLQELAEGTIRYETSGEYHTSATRQVKKTKRSLEATALVNYDQWLESGTLKEYLDIQAELIRKTKINVTRIFIWDENQRKNKHNIDVAKMHAEKGINVYIAKKEEIPRTLHDMLTKPFAIFDDEVAFVGELDPEEGKIIKGIKTIVPSKIDELKDMFNTIRIHHSRKLEDFLNAEGFTNEERLGNRKR